MWCLKIFLTLLIVAVTCHIIWRTNNARAVARLEKATREHGEPLSFAELAATYPPVPDGSNAYVALRDIWVLDDPDRWNGFDNGERDLKSVPQEKPPKGLPIFGRTRTGLKPSDPLAAETVEITEDYLSPKRAQMSAVREAVKRPKFRAPVQFQDGMSALLPYLDALKSEARLFQLESACAVEAGRINDSLDCIEAIGNLSRCLKDEPFIVCQRVRLALSSIAMESAEHLTSRCQPDETQLSRLTSIIAALDSRDGLKRSMIGERAMLFGFLDSPARAYYLANKSRNDEDEEEDKESPEQAANKWALGMKVFEAFGMITAEKRSMGETFAKAIEHSESPEFVTPDTFSLIFETAQSNAWKFPPRIFSAMLLGSYSRTGEKFNRTEVMRRCSLAAIAVERYRLRNHGALPESLGALPTEFLTASIKDTFGGQTLHFKKLPDGFVVYSVGPDFKDNDALLGPPKTGPWPREMDVGFAVERSSGQ